MATEMITLRVTPEQKAKLETLANQQGVSVSDVIRKWIDTDLITVEVPEEYADIVSWCALLKGQTVPEFVREYLPEWLNWPSIKEYRYVNGKILQLLREKPMSKDELTALLPEWVRVDWHVDYLSWAYKDVGLNSIELRPDGKYEVRKEL